MLSRSSIVLFERYCQNKIFEGVHFEIQIGGPKSFPFKWKHWFLVSGMSELSKNIFGYNSPQNSNERFFLDIATLTKSVVLLYYVWRRQVSRNFSESSEMEHDLQVSQKCYKISWNLGNLIDLMFFCKKACFWCESERIFV